MEEGRRRAREVESPQLDSQQSEARKDTTEASQDFDLHLYIKKDNPREMLKMLLESEEAVIM